MAGHASTGESLARLKLQVSLDDPFSISTPKLRHYKSSPSFDVSKAKDNEVLKGTLDDVTKEIAMHRQRSSITQGLIEARTVKSVALPDSIPADIRELLSAKPPKIALDQLRQTQGTAITESRVTAQEQKISFFLTARIVMMQIRWKRKYRERKQKEEERVKRKAELQRLRRKSRQNMAGIKD